VKRDLVVAGLEPSPQCDGSGQTGVVQHLVRVAKKTELVAKDSLGESAVICVATERLRAVSSWEVSLRQGAACGLALLRWVQCLSTVSKNTSLVC